MTNIRTISGKIIHSVLFSVIICTGIVCFISWVIYEKHRLADWYLINRHIDFAIEFIVCTACWGIATLIRYRHQLKDKRIPYKFGRAIFNLGKKCWKWITSNYLTIIITIAFIFVFMHYENKIIEAFFKLINTIVDSNFGKISIRLFGVLLLIPTIDHAVKTIKNKTLSDGRTYFFSIVLCCLLGYCSIKYPWKTIIYDRGIVNPLNEQEWTLVFLFNMYGLSMLIVPLILFFVVDRLSQLHKETLSTTQEGGYLPDSPITSSKHDHLAFSNHVKLMKELIEKIPTTNTHSIAITGGWGSGKTSFLYLLQEKLSEQNQYEIVWFFPMKSLNSDNIQSDFFDVLETTLSKYKTGFGRHIRYYKELIGAIDNKYISFLVKLWSVRLQEERERINDTLKSLPKRIIVIIDDVDRLKEDEIKQVFRLVGFNANFDNVLFLIALDKGHINETLKCDTHYPDKFFETEFPLPDNYIYNVRLFIKHAIKMINPKNEIPLDFLNDDSIIDYTKYCLNSLRDVNRFLNDFIGRVIEIYNKDTNMDVCSYYLLSLIRYKNPFLFERIKNMDEGLLMKAEESNKQIWELNRECEALKNEWKMEQLLTKLFSKDSKRQNNHGIYQYEFFPDYFNEASFKSVNEQLLLDLLSSEHENEIQQKLNHYNEFSKTYIIELLEGHDKKEYTSRLLAEKKEKAEVYITNYYRVLYILGIETSLDYPEGLAFVETVKNQRYAYIDIEGIIAFTIDCYSANSFCDGRAMITKQIKTKLLKGFVNKNGNIEIDFKYDHANNFSNGCALVQKNGKYGFIDKKDNTIIPFEYNDAKSFFDGFAPVKKGDKWGFIDLSGITIINFEYDDVADTFGFFPNKVKKDGVWGLVDKEGNFSPNDNI